ncbi:MAG: LTA synthase family protein [Granulosicoccus sp.]
MTLFHRLMALRVYYHLNNFAVSHSLLDGIIAKIGFINYFGTSILNGLRDDVIFCLLATLAIVFLHRKLRIIALVLLAMFYAANVEHIRYNFTNINFALVSAAVDMTFVRAQLSEEFFDFFLLCLAVWACIAYLGRYKPTVIVSNLITVIVLLAIALPIYSSNFTQPQWMQTHPLLPISNHPQITQNNRSFEEAPFTANTGVSVPERFQPVRNLLIVYLEGLSHLSIESGDMSYLKSLESENTTYTRHFGHQLITANGLYTSLTGNLPRFISEDLRWDEILAKDADVPLALPIVLKNHGYQTGFFQSAPNGYMSKDQILPLLGFDTVFGDEQHPEHQARSGWGIDDKSLFTNALNHIDSLDPDSPWMLGILNTGTHSPYFSPDDFLPESTDNRYRALRYLDEAIFELIEGLKARQLLNNTVVVITSDESREMPGGMILENEIALGWLPLILMTPETESQSINEYVMNSELPGIILNSLGKEKFEESSYKKNSIVFGNVITNRLVWYDISTQELLSCNTQSFVCGLYGEVSDLANLTKVKPLQQAYFPNLEALIKKYE